MLGDASGSFAKSISNAGLILNGPYSPCAASDYIVGTDHVLPTEGFAKNRSGLSVLDFVKVVWTVEGSKEGLRSVLGPLKALANAEGLPNHYLSVSSRFEGIENE
jgi:histidinol dehydrogenase